MNIHNNNHVPLCKKWFQHFKCFTYCFYDLTHIWSYEAVSSSWLFFKYNWCYSWHASAQCGLWGTCSRRFISPFNSLSWFGYCSQWWYFNLPWWWTPHKMTHPLREDSTWQSGRCLPAHFWLNAVRFHLAHSQCAELPRLFLPVHLMGWRTEHIHVIG